MMNIDKQITYQINTSLTDEEIKIRTDIFLNEQHFTTEFDDLDLTSYHLILYLNKIAIGVLRYYKERDNIYHIGRVAIKKEYRHQQYGVILIQIAEKEILKLGGEVILLGAQLKAQPFYIKCGYEAYGDIYYDEYCPHQMMKKLI